MTSLHLGVWHSLRSNDCSTVNTLLEYDADCNAKDDDILTPLNHLSLCPGSEKLRKILNQYLEEQRKRKALETCSPTISKMDELECELSNIVSLNDLILHRLKKMKGEGEIIFVDEAYHLIPMQKSDDKDYGWEALEEIMSTMENGKIVVIFAVYSEPMKWVICSNEGFYKRVTKFFYFDDFSSKDLANITHVKMNNQVESSLLYGFRLHSLCTLDTIAELIERETTVKQCQEMNGGLIDPLLVNAWEYLDLRLSFDCMDSNELLTITLEDLEARLQYLLQ